MTTPTPPTAGQAAAALPGAQALGVFLNAGPMDGRPGLDVPGRGHEPSAADARFVSPEPTAAQCMDDRIREAYARAVIRPIPFPANPWRAADGGGVEHDLSVALICGVGQTANRGGAIVATTAHEWCPTA